MIYQKILENILLPLGDLINKSNYIKQLNYWRKVDDFTEEELKKLQSKNLETLLKHSIASVPYYASILLKGDNPYQWIEQFPILTKENLRNGKEKLLSCSKKDLIEYSSSGSSGMQSSVFMSKKEQSILRGVLTHWWEWSGYKIGQPLVQTGITPERGLLKSIKDVFFRTIYINAFTHTEEQLKRLCDRLQNTNRYHFSGYASSLNVIAEYALANKYNIKLKSAISLGDKLFSHYRENVEKAFKCKVYDTYGSNEGLMIAAQKDLEYLYILSPHVYIEIVDDEGNAVPDGEMGHILATRLDGFSMPLIRYKLGDLGILLPEEKYPEKRVYKYPLLQQIVGRETDIVVLPSGKKLVVHSFTGVFEYIPEIKQFKVIQENKKGICIEFIKADSFTNSVLQEATQKLQKYIQDENFEIQYKEVTEIALSKSGKPQIIESKL